MPPGAWLLFAIFAAAAVQSAVGLATLRSNRGNESVFSTPEADATHLVMNAVMAAMVTPAYSAPVRAGAIVLLAATAAGVAVALVRHRPGAPSAGPLSFGAYAVTAAYHVLMLAAMIYALIVMTASVGAMCSGGMGAMRPMASAPRHWLTLPHTLAVLFALDAATGAMAVVALPHQLLAAESMATTSGTALISKRVRNLRVGFVPHLVMDLGTVWMLLVN